MEPKVMKVWFRIDFPFQLMWFWGEPFAVHFPGFFLLEKNEEKPVELGRLSHSLQIDYIPTRKFPGVSPLFQLAIPKRKGLKINSCLPGCPVTMAVPAGMVPSKPRWADVFDSSQEDNDTIAPLPSPPLRSDSFQVLPEKKHGNS